MLFLVWVYVGLGAMVLGGVLNLCRCVGAVFLNLDRGVHLGGNNYSFFLLFQILAAF